MDQFRQWLTVTVGDADQRRRGQNLVTISLLLLGLVLASLPVIATRAAPAPSLIANAIGVIVISMTIGLARRGKVDLASWILVGFSQVGVAVPLMLRPEVSSSIFYLLLPVIISGLVLRPWQVWLVVGSTLAVIGVDVLITDPALFADPISFDLVVNTVLIIGSMGTISFIGARINTQGFSEAAAARHEAERAAGQLQTMNTGLETAIAARTEELRRAFADVEARSSAQAVLLAEVQAQAVVIHELSVPVLPISADTLVMPLVGALDTDRLQRLQSRALSAVEQTRARRLLLDITGVPVVDTQVAQGLIQVIQATRLLGAEPMLVGVRPEVAQTLVTLGIDLAHVQTAASLQSGLQRKR